VLGREPLVQFLVPFDGGRLQVTQAAWDVQKREWFDVFADDRAAGEWGHWTGGGMTWNSQCASCHSTGVRKGWDPSKGAYGTTATAHGVTCAACHGDPAAHAAGGPPPSDLRLLDGCGSCHARRAELTEGYVVGEPFLDHFAPHLVDRTDAFWPDGQVREEDFEYGAFLGSRMHEAGVTCTSCHDPHSGRLRAEGDALCLGCHEKLPGFAAHDRHEPPGPGCVGCHMPVTTYMQRDPRHDHSFGIPDPWTNAKLGIPDACTRCHGDRDAAWATKQATAWWGDLGGPRRDRTVAIAGGRAGDASAVPGLIGVLSDPKGAWRAAAAGVLEGFVDRPEVRRALIDVLDDPDGHVRFAAAGALAPVAPDPEVDRALAPLLSDPLRAVRIQAARGLRFRLSPGSASMADYVEYLRQNADTPAALHERATWAIERGDLPSAVRDLQAAVGFDPNSVAVRDTYAVALAGYGRPGDAAAQLREVVRLAPNDAAGWFRLGLAEAGAGDLPAAEAAMDRSVTLDPSDARAWYNLGLVRQQLGRGASAVAALERAVTLSPDPETAYGLASTLFAQGRVEEARAVARKVLAVAPDHPGARSIVGP
jgi:predicted CXXCH cytochrome family protein